MYKALIDKNLTLAFDRLKDLAVDATLIRKEVDAFVFGTSEVTSKDVNTSTVKAVVTEIRDSFSPRNLVRKQIMMKTADVADISFYSKIEVEGDVYSIDFPLVSSVGFITVFNINKGA